MATGGKEIVQSATTTDVTPGNKTSPEEPWATASGEMYKARVWEDLRNLFQQDELTDVMLAAEGQSIPCHRVLLAAASKFFHGKFVINPESVEHNLLDIEGIDFDTLTSVVSFIYNGRADVTVEKTERLLPASVNLMLPELTNMCKDFLLHKVKDDTSACIAIHRIATANSIADVGDKAWQVMLHKFQDLTGTAAFKHMSETELQTYIRDEELNVASEDPVFEAIVAWVRHDVEDRKSIFEKLISNVTLSHCSPGYLRDTVRKEPLMNTMAGLQMLADSLSNQLVLHSTAQHGTARRGYSGHGAGNTLIAIFEDQYWTLKDGESEWVNQGSSQGKKLRYSSACMTGDGILVTGGVLSSRLGGSKKCWKLSLPKLSWATVPDLNVAREYHAMVCIGSQVCVLGGYDGQSRFSSVEYLDEQTGSWHVAGDHDMPSVLAGHTAISYKQFIYVFGGYNGKEYSLETLAISTPCSSGNTWRKKANMPGPCSKGSSVVYRDRIYILGGIQNSCMSYDPDQDQWKSHSKPAVKHDLPSAVVWKDRILLCGGENTSVIEEYNPDTDTWSEWKHQLPIAASIPPAVFSIND